MTFELFFDATDTMDGSVVARVEQLFSCCVPTDDSLGKKKSLPPLVVLHWGDVKSFAGFVTSVQAKYTLFTGKGTPIRATCNVSLEEMPGDPLKQNPTSGSLTLTSVRTVVAGDSLASIAYREYGDPGDVAPARPVQRHRRPAPPAAGLVRAPARRRRPHGRGVTWPRPRSATPSR